MEGELESLEDVAVGGEIWQLLLYVTEWLKNMREFLREMKLLQEIVRLSFNCFTVGQDRRGAEKWRRLKSFCFHRGKFTALK